MVKSYCVRQKKQTECVPGSERYVQAKNGRMMLKCTCAECGITKTKFIKSEITGGAARKASTNPYCGIGKVPTGRKRGSATDCYNQGQVRYYGMNDIPKNLYETLEKAKRDEIKHKRLLNKLKKAQKGN